MSDPRRRLPGVDRLLESPDVEALLARWPRTRVVAALRTALEEARRDVGVAVPDDLREPSRYARAAAARLREADRPSLVRVINATGVILHTNVGRAPLAAAARTALTRVSRGYSNLEMDLERGERGSRYVHCADLVRELIGAGDALVVNNCAAALTLAMGTLAPGRPVVVSRGELVEIGGGFRIPEILKRAGVRLVEVGSTNRTRLADYREGVVRAGAALILKVHRSNFRISGFTEEAELAELAALARDLGVRLVHDLGTGLLADPARLGLPPEPRPGESLTAGVDLVSFSGDKLLGGPQAGVLAGTAQVVSELRANPLCRAFRVDKGTLAALEATLRLYRDEEEALREIPVLRMLAAPVTELEARAGVLAQRLTEAGVQAEAASGRAAVGGGTLPGVELESRVVRIVGPGSPARLAQRARTVEPPAVPVVGRVVDDRLVLDLRTVSSDEEADLVATLVAAVREEG